MAALIKIFVFVLSLVSCLQLTKSQNCMQFSASPCGEDGGHPQAVSTGPSTQGLPGKRGPTGHPGQIGPKGSKGERGAVAKNHTREITELENQVEMLQQKSDILEGKLEEVVRNNIELQRQLQLLANPPIKTRYSVIRTPRKGNYDQARLMCVQMGGDLLQKCLSTSVHGVSYASEIRTLVERATYALWIGVDNRDGPWRYLNGDNFHGHTNQRQDLLYFWDQGQPEASSECGGIMINRRSLHDFTCVLVAYGICEVPIISVEVEVPYRSTHNHIEVP